MSENADKKRLLYIIISITVVLALIALGSFLLWPVIVSTIKTPELFRDFVYSKGALGPIIFILIQMAQIIFAFIPGEIVELGGGYAFGAWAGLGLCLIGVFLSTCIIFFSVRKFGHSFAEMIMDKNSMSRLKFLNDEHKLVLIMFIIYFVPGTPKDLITYFAGLTKIKPSHFLLISVLGRIPSILTSTYTGAKLLERDYITGIIIFGVSALIAAAGYFGYHFFTKKHGAEKSGKKQAGNNIDTEENN